MKKRLSIFTAAMTIGLMVSACGQSATSTPEEKKDVTLEEVFVQSQGAMDEISSFKGVINMEQSITFPGEDTTVTTVMNSNMEMIMEPISLYQTVDMSMSGEGDFQEEQGSSYEAYLTSEGFYLYDSLSEVWFKAPDEMSKDVFALSQPGSNPFEQYEELETFMNDFTIEENDTTYTLELKASGEEISDFLKEHDQLIVPAELGTVMSEEELKEKLVLEDVAYVITLRKDDLFMNNFVATMNMIVEINGQNVSIAQKIKMGFHEYNTIKEIIIPQEVIDTAVENAF